MKDDLKKIDVLVCGRSTVDIIMNVDSFTNKPIKNFASNFVFTTGGPAANASIAIARQNSKVSLITKLGNDFLGEFILKNLKNENIDIEKKIISNNANSSSSIALIDKNGERQTINYPGDGFLSITKELFSNFHPKIVLADNRYNDITRFALEFANENKIPAVLDAESPFDKNVAKYATHIAFSMQGFKNFISFKDINNALKVAQNELKCWICVTDGENGVFICDKKNNVNHVKAFKINAVDTVGAGDIWHGIFAMKLADGLKENEAVLYANAVSAIKCSKFGGINSCPDKEESQKFILDQKL